jgi:hypothetical protein
MKKALIFIFVFVLFIVLEQHSTKYLLVEVEDSEIETFQGKLKEMSMILRL